MPPSSPAFSNASFFFPSLSNVSFFSSLLPVFFSSIGIVSAERLLLLQPYAPSLLAKIYAPFLHRILYPQKYGSGFAGPAGPAKTLVHHPIAQHVHYMTKEESTGKDPLRNGVLAVQTIRNNIMASTLLASTAITLSSLIGVVVSSTKDSASSLLIYGNTTQLASSVKYFTILVCFLAAFLFNVQSIRYYAHASFLVSVPPPKDDKGWVDYIARSLNRGSYFWSLGLRAFYVSFPLFLWIFGPIPMFACCCIVVSMLYFLDTTTSFTRQLHHFLGEDGKEMQEGESGYPSA